jgi:uncharacterized protein (TIGR02145 family)
MKNIFPFSVFEGYDDLQRSSFTDPRDGQTYSTIIVKSLGVEWFAQNLNYDLSYKLSTFVTDLFDIDQDPSVSYDNEENNRKDHGLLYTFDGAQDACPEGWQIPTRNDWVGLFTRLTGLPPHLRKMADDEKIFPVLTDPDKFNFGFDGGCEDPHNTRRREKFRFMHLGDRGYYWSSTKGSLGNGGAVFSFNGDDRYFAEVVLYGMFSARPMKK